MRFSIIIPVYNEEKTIGRVIDQISKVKLGKEIEKEIIVVDDGSTDNTKRILTEFSKKRKIKIFTHSRNLGKGAAVRTGLRHASGKFVLIQDADLEYNPKDIPKLLRPIMNENYQVVYGTQMREKVKPEFYLSLLGNKLLAFTVNLLYKSNLSDVFVGYKVFRENLLDNVELKSNGFEIEIELTAKFLKKKAKIKEVPISYQGRSWREGKKINFGDGIVCLLLVFYWRFFN